MSPSFIFEAASDEENEFSEHESDEEESQSQSESEGGESESENERIEPRVSKKKTVSPWDFTKYTESVAEEHARRSTTSVQDKIYAVKQRSAPVVALPDSDDDSGSDAEADKQVIIGFLIFIFIFHIHNG
jgi:ATP-dependent RNA helicase DDX27